MKHARPDYQRIQDPAGIIPDDEPVFLLRGQDRIAPWVLMIYALIAKLLGLDPALIASVNQQANDMEKWPVTKDPDLSA